MLTALACNRPQLRTAFSIRKKAKVLFYLFFPAGGIGKYTHQQLEELVHNEDLEIEVACLPNYQWRENDSYRTWPGLLGISHRIAPIRKLRFLMGQFINPRRLIHRAMHKQADIIHICNINYLSFPAWEGLLDAWQGKLVCTAHDIRRRVSILNRRWEEKQLQRFYRRCDAVFVHSEQQKQELQSFADVSSSKIYVVPHGPHAYPALNQQGSDALRQRLNVPLDRQVALFFGFIRPDKNLDGFIRAMAIAGEQRLHLLVAGNTAAQGDAYLQQCRALAKQQGLEGQMSFDVRYITDEEVPHWFGLCDWVLSTHGPEFSSQSGVLNLAAYYQKPVLATPSASIQELLGDVDIGVLCDGFSDEEIAGGIRSIVARLNGGDRFDFEGYRERYSWVRNAELTHQVYRQ